MEAGVGGDDEHYGGRKGRKARREGKGVRPLLLLAGNKPFEKLVLLLNQMDERVDNFASRTKSLQVGIGNDIMANYVSGVATRQRTLEAIGRQIQVLSFFGQSTAQPPRPPPTRRPQRQKLWGSHLVGVTRRRWMAGWLAAAYPLDTGVSQP